jgi:hypothetical protein
MREWSQVKSKAAAKSCEQKRAHAAFAIEGGCNISKSFGYYSP